MGRIATEKPGERTPRYPSPRAPIPGPAIYLDAKDKDIPYDGYFKRPPRGAESSYFDQPLGLREEGAMLLAILTGVQGSPFQKLAPGIPGFSLLYGVGREGARESPRHADGTTLSQALKMDLRMDATAGLSANAAMEKHHPKLEKVIQPVDECVDTRDLEALTAEKEPEGSSKSWLFETVEEEELYKFTEDLEAKAGAGKEISLKEYIALVKKSANRLGMRTQMLQDLCLAEDVDLGVIDLPAAPPPPSKPSAAGANLEKPEDPAKPKPYKDQYVGSMCATSLVVKKARRLAGLMHTEQQTIDLRDVWDWLQHLGYFFKEPIFMPPGIQAKRIELLHPRRINQQTQRKQMAQLDVRVSLTIRNKVTGGYLLLQPWLFSMLRRTYVNVWHISIKKRTPWRIESYNSLLLRNSLAKWVMQRNPSFRTTFMDYKPWRKDMKLLEERLQTISMMPKIWINVSRR